MVIRAHIGPLSLVEFMHKRSLKIDNYLAKNSIFILALLIGLDAIKQIIFLIGLAQQDYYLTRQIDIQVALEFIG